MHLSVFEWVIFVGVTSSDCRMGPSYGDVPDLKYGAVLSLHCAVGVHWTAAINSRMNSRYRWCFQPNQNLLRIRVDSPLAGMWFCIVWK